jgi:hypothetical protein
MTKNTMADEFATLGLGPRKSGHGSLRELD